MAELFNDPILLFPDPVVLLEAPFCVLSSCRKAGSSILRASKVPKLEGLNHTRLGVIRGGYPRL